jgi:hypothetical protein
MSRKPNTPFNADEVARSFVIAFLKHTRKEMTLCDILKTALVLKENDRYGRKFNGPQAEALTVEKLTKAAKDLCDWNQIALVSKDTYCLHEFMPKYRTLDDTWQS